MPLKPRDVIDASDPRVSQIGHPAPPWMVNYADLMTELVCLFVIMYGLSGTLSKPVQEARKEVEQVITKEDVPGNVNITKDGLVITIQEQGFRVFFKSGSADLTDQMKEILDKLAPTFQKMAAKRYDMIVEGHTDDVPIHTDEFPSNWELSTARATNVVKYLLEKYKYPPEHIAAIGYGQNTTLPRAQDEDLNAWRSKNRRVVFVIKNPDKPNAKEVAASVSDAAVSSAPPAEAKP